MTIIEFWQKIFEDNNANLEIILSLIPRYKPNMQETGNDKDVIYENDKLGNIVIFNDDVIHAVRQVFAFGFQQGMIYQSQNQSENPSDKIIGD